MIHRFESKRSAAASLSLFALVAGATAHVRLRYEVDGTPLSWESPENVSLVIQEDGSDDISDGSHATAIRNAFESWNAVTGARARVVESSTGRSRRDWQSPDIHLAVFDENNSSGFFGGASSIVAVTPVTFYTDGRIVDADIVFNGKNFTFTTSGESGAFDVQDVAAHELGHFLGLDHSGVCGSTMYPYVDASVILHRSLALDDTSGLRHLYPAEAFARVSGSIERAGSGAPVRGAHVVARDADGHVAGAILSGSDGSFVLQGLDAGQYTVYVDPLDRPVSSANLGGGQTIETDFESRVLGTVTVATGQVEELGAHTVGPDVAVQLGRVSDDFPQRIVRGLSTQHLLRGTDLTPGSTLTCSDPSIALTNIAWSHTAVAFTATVPAGAPLGHVDLTAETQGGEIDVLVGALEITPADPAVVDVSPTSGEPAGGTAVTIVGDAFRPGARVVIGDRIYRDGEPNGCVVLDPHTITLTTGETVAGRHDVVVIDPTGVEGRAADGFDIATAPGLTSVFPAVGASSGGTTLELFGTDFVPDTVVSIDGVVQSSIEVLSPTRLRVVTTPGVPGGPYVLRVESPGGQFAESAFTYVAESDPELSMISPGFGDVSGGQELSILGAGFTPGTEVVFGADERTGTGGTPAAVVYIDEGLLLATTPSSSIGTTSVMVRKQATGQATLMSAGFTFTGDVFGGDDDGGGCSAVLPSGPPNVRDVIAGSGWIAAAFLISLICAAGTRRRAIA